MRKYLRSFFAYTFKTYTYHQPKEALVATIDEVLKVKPTFLGVKDIEGYFINATTFTIKLISPYSKSILYGAALIAEIKELQDGVTEIKTRVRAGLVLYLLFFIALIFGVVYLYEFVQTSSIDFLLGSLAMLIGGPVISIALASIANAAVYERFDRYIDNELRKEKV
jgi:hypothetical protein